jgi:hypothetical protein
LRRGRDFPAEHAGLEGDSEFIRANYSRQSILELETTLRRIAEEESPSREILWEMRQAAFRHG